MDAVDALVLMEQRAAKGGHDEEQALIHLVRQLGNTFQLGDVGKEIAAEGKGTFFESRNQTSIDFGEMAIHRMPNGDVTAVKRDAKGRVTELAYPDDVSIKFDYHGNTSNVDSFTQRSADGTEKKTVSDPIGLSIRVDHEGNMTMAQFLSSEVKYGVDGSVRLDSGHTVMTGDGSSSGKFLVPSEVHYKDGTTRKFNLDNGQILDFTEPQSGEKYSRSGVEYTANDGSKYFEWNGNKGHRWRGSIEFVQDPGMIFSKILAVSHVGDSGNPAGNRFDTQNSADLISQ